MMRLLRHLGFLCALGTVSSAALADVVVMDFDELPPGASYEYPGIGASYYENVTFNGLRLSPSNHVDIYYGWMGFDGPGGANSSYLGQAPASGLSSVYIDYFGQAFSFTSFLLDPSSSSGGTVSSSKGGFLDFDGPVVPGLYSLSGPQWNDITWIEFATHDAGLPKIHLDDLTFGVPGFAAPVPEPETYAMLLLGLGVVGFVSRRQLRNRV
jgi:PEP-CTERM motif